MLQYNPSISGSLSVTGSLIVTNDISGTINGINVSSFSSSISQLVTSIQSSAGSQNSKLTSIESFTSSTSARLESIETISASNLNRIGSLEIISASNVARINSLETTSASVDILNIAQTARIVSLEEKTGSLATTGSNTFYGTQVFSGSVYIKENLIVQGSSSLQNITASAVDIGTNKIILNVNNPAVRYAGISVYDSGSTGGTGSLWWDSVNNHWLYEHPADSGAPYNSAILISGPKNAGNLGEELELVNNFIVKAVGGDHISSSAIYDDGTTIKLLSNTEVTGSFKTTQSGIIGNAFTIQGGTGLTKHYFTSAGSGDALNQLYDNSGNVKVQLYTNGNSYFNGGKVGIGTATPQASLHITSQADTTGLMIGAGNGYEIFITGSDSANIYHASPNQAIYLNTNGGKLHLGTSSASTLLTISGSNVGIGIDNPEGIFDVYKSNSAGLGGHIILRNNGSAVANETAVLFVDGGIGSVRAAISSTTENSPYFGDIKFKTGATSYGSLNTRMIITGAGNVGMGTASPNYPLHVYKGGSIATINVGSSAGQNLQFRMEEAGAVKSAITWVPADASTRFFSNGTDKLTIASGGNIGLNRTAPLATLSVYGGAIQLMGDYANHQTIIKTTGTAGTLYGSLTITVPDMAGAGSSVGYGGFSCEVYVAGYNAVFCHAWFSGYTNMGVTASETAILRSSGNWSVSQYGNGSQGLTFVIDYQGITHPTARIIINKGGHVYENEYPANSITTVWS